MSLRIRSKTNSGIGWLCYGRRGSNLDPSPACVSLTKTFEGYKDTAYPDPGTGAEPWTIGYGHTAGVTEGMTCTQEQAECWLAEDLANAAYFVRKYVTVPLNQNQFDSLTDFVFNLGPGEPGEKDGFVWLKSGQPSTMLRFLNAGDCTGAAMEFPKWNLPPLPGIIRRRATEQALFLRDDNLEPVT